MAQYDLVIKGGRVLDPARGASGVDDIGIQGGRIRSVSGAIPLSEARKVIPAEGRVVVPGLIDMHCHPGAIDKGTLHPDEIGIHAGVTTLCEGGEAGAGNFHPLLEHEIRHSVTDMFCFLNFAVAGLAGFPQPEICQENDINPALTRQVVEENRAFIKGIKLRVIAPMAESMGMKVVEAAKQLASDLHLPLVLHIGEGRQRRPGDTIDDFVRQTVKLLESGDVLSHFLTWEAGGVISSEGFVSEELLKAQKRGVVLDACMGASHFSFSIARHAVAQGVLPTVISTDMNAANMQVVQSLPVAMSKLLNLGIPLEQVVAMTTANPARVLGEDACRGTMKPGMAADITILEVVKGEFLFSDGKGGDTLEGDRLIEPRLVIKNGRETPVMSRYQLTSG